MITMWFDILKNLQATTQTSGSFDFEEEEIPEKDDEDCIKKLLNIYDKANHKYNGTYTKFWLKGRADIDKFPEELICKALDLFKGIPDEIRSDDDNMERIIEKPVGSGSEIWLYKLYPVSPYGNLLTGIIAFYRDYYFEIKIQYINTSDDDLDNEKLNADAKGKDYLNACKHVFGEYF